VGAVKRIPRLDQNTLAPASDSNIAVSPVSGLHFMRFASSQELDYVLESTSHEGYVRPPVARSFHTACKLLDLEDDNIWSVWIFGGRDKDGAEIKMAPL